METMNNSISTTTTETKTTAGHENTGRQEDDSLEDKQNLIREILRICGRNGRREIPPSSSGTWNLYENAKHMLMASCNDPRFTDMIPTMDKQRTRALYGTTWVSILPNVNGLKDHEPGPSLIPVMVVYYDIMEYCTDPADSLKAMGYDNAARLSALIHYHDSPLPKATRRQLYQAATEYARQDCMEWFLNMLAEDMEGMTLEQIAKDRSLPAEFIRVDADRNRTMKAQSRKQKEETLIGAGNPIFGRLASRLYPKGVSSHKGEHSILMSALLETFGYQRLLTDASEAEKTNGSYHPREWYSIIAPNDTTMVAANPNTRLQDGTIRRRLATLRRFENLPDILLGCFPNRSVPAIIRPQHQYRMPAPQYTEGTGPLIDFNMCPAQGHESYNGRSIYYMFHEFRPWSAKHEPATRLDWLEHLLDMDNENEQYRQIMWIHMRQTAVERWYTSMHTPTCEQPEELRPWVEDGIPPKGFHWEHAGSISFNESEGQFGLFHTLTGYGDMGRVFAEIPKTVDELRQRMRETGAVSGDDLYRMIIIDHQRRMSDSLRDR